MGNSGVDRFNDRPDYISSYRSTWQLMKINLQQHGIEAQRAFRDPQVLHVYQKMSRKIGLFEAVGYAENIVKKRRNAVKRLRALFIIKNQRRAMFYRIMHGMITDPNKYYDRGNNS